MLIVRIIQAQFSTSNIRGFTGLSYFNSLFEKYDAEPTSDYENGKGAAEFTDGELANVEQRVSSVLGQTEGSQKVDITQLGTGVQTSTCENAPLIATCCPWPSSGQLESSRIESTTTIVQGIVGGPTPCTAGGEPPTFYESPDELPVVSPSQRHHGVRFKASVMDGEVRFQEPTATGIIDLGSKKSIGEEGMVCRLSQECEMHLEARVSGIKSKIQRASESECQPKDISFKLPVSRIPDSGSLGFSFGPRFEETTGSRALELRPTLNPFEDIERQGRCSPLNHPRSPPGSRHHSRSSTVGLQAFRPFPPAMKTSKETGDQPPVIPSPPLLPGTGRNDIITGVGTLKVETGQNLSHVEATCFPDVS